MEELMASLRHCLAIKFQDMSGLPKSIRPGIAIVQIYAAIVDGFMESASGLIITPGWITQSLPGQTDPLPVHVPGVPGDQVTAQFFAHILGSDPLVAYLFDLGRTEDRGYSGGIYYAFKYRDSLDFLQLLQSLDWKLCQQIQRELIFQIEETYVVERERLDSLDAALRRDPMLLAQIS